MADVWVKNGQLAGMVDKHLSVNFSQHVSLLHSVAPLDPFVEV